MLSECDKRRMLYETGEVGASVRLSLGGLEVAQAHHALLAAGFRHTRVPLSAERAADGSPKWRLTNGGSTKDPRAADLLPADSYAHLDGGWVLLLPKGDPRGRIVPSLCPSAIKSVLFVAPQWRIHGVTRERYLDANTYFDNVAFRVTDDGEAIPKSHRAAHGLRYEAQMPLKSFQFADQTFRRGIIELRPTEAK